MELIKSLFRSVPIYIAALAAATVANLGAQATNVLTVSPASLVFNYAQGDTQPVGILLISSNQGSASYRLTPSTVTGGSWLSVAPSTGLTTVGVQQSVQAIVDPTNLPVGAYDGNVRIEASNVSNSPLNVPVRLNVLSAGTVTTQLAASPASLAFFAQPGAVAPASAYVRVTSTTTTPITYTIAVSDNWLSASGVGGVTVTPADVQVSVNHAGLIAGAVYNGNVILTPTSGAGTSKTIPVSLSVGSTTGVNSSLTASPSRFIFNYQTGYSAPQQQVLTIGSTQGSLNFTATATSTGNWLAINSIGAISGATPSSVVLNANPGALGPGSYPGNIRISAPGTSDLNVEATLVVSSSPLINMSAASLNFQYSGGAAPAAQIVHLSSTSAPLNYSMQALPGSPWLTVNSFNGVDFSVGIIPSLLPAGSASSNLIITAAGAGNSPLYLPVTVNGASSSSLIAVTRDIVTFTDILGSLTAPAAQTFDVYASDNSAVQFNIIPNYPSGTPAFLTVQPANGTTRSTISVAINRSAISVAGTYQASLSVVPLNANPNLSNTPAIVNITLTVTGTTTVTANPSSVSFTPPSGSSTPQTQTIQLNSTTAGVTFSASAQTATGNWLAVSVNNNATTPTLTITANPLNLGPGRYDGSVTVSGASQLLTIPVTLFIATTGTLTVTPGSLTFDAQTFPANSNPAPKLIQLSSTGTQVSFNATAATNSGGGWLDVNPKSGVTGQVSSLSVTVNSTGLAAGQYAGNITVAGVGTSNPPQTVSVILNVTAAAIPQINSIVNAATFAPTAIAPGLIVTIFGNNLGPPAITGLRLNASGLLETTLADTQVLFDGTPAPMVYVSANQVAAIAPYGVFGRLSTRIQVQYQGQRSTSLDIRVVDTAPGIFSLNSQGTGQAAALNQNGTVNTPSNPITRGEVIVLYMTGEGQTNPQGVDGQVTSAANLKKPLAPITVKIDGINAVVDYAGSAPGLVAGVMQVNVRVPLGSRTGPGVPVEVAAGAASISNATISVQ
ncbi:MAG TPA: IPT/TIG domain-containing protein [Bryobacteraceae bacterium]|nr:IPT/TIG domain-containing protein [Bryobacteraceae bacterium]